MAQVIQIVSTNENDTHFEPAMVNGEWHATMFTDTHRTLCGIQLEGADGYTAGPAKVGRVTCGGCRSVLKQVQAIKGWQ